MTEQKPSKHINDDTAHGRVALFVDGWPAMGGMHPDVVHSIANRVTGHEKADLRISDLRKVLSGVSDASAKWAEHQHGVDPDELAELAVPAVEEFAPAGKAFDVADAVIQHLVRAAVRFIRVQPDDNWEV